MTIIRVLFLFLWIKKCQKCQSKSIQKWGQKRGRQNYKCKDCKHSFQNRRRTKKSGWIKKVYHEYSSRKQTYKELSKDYQKDPKTLRKYFDRHEPATGEIIVPSKPINLVMDATFFSRKDGVIIARAESKNLYWKYIETEKIQHYKETVSFLEKAGCTFLSFTIDGRRGVRQMLEKTYSHIPIQYCIFHQIKTIHRYISRRPKLEAGKELREIVLTLSKAKKKDFIKTLSKWHGKWKEFLKEKSTNSYTKRWHYTHKRLRSAYRSLERNLPYLFTFQNYPKRNIPTTTNSCDGSFTHWKNKVKLHRGMKKHRRNKMINYFLENS